MKIKADKMCELEKFGFKHSEANSYFYKVENNFGGFGGFIVYSRELILQGKISGDVGDKLLDVFYQLIKADMVEE